MCQAFQVPDQSTSPTEFTDLPLWEQRVRARRVGLPDWAEDAPDRCAVVATTADGVIETHSWSPGAEPVQLTRRSDGTIESTIDPAGEWIWWFDDKDGDEHGVWRRQPFGSAPGEGVLDATGLPAAYSVGLAIGRARRRRRGIERRRVRQPDPRRRHQRLTPPSARLLYEHEESAYVGGLSRDETLVAIGHSEHGDSRHPALRVVRLADGSTVGGLLGRRRARACGRWVSRRSPVTSGWPSSTSGPACPGLLIWDPTADPDA